MRRVTESLPAVVVVGTDRLLAGDHVLDRDFPAVAADADHFGQDPGRGFEMMKRESTDDDVE